MTGNSITYFLPQEDITINNDTIIMEIGLHQPEEAPQPGTEQSGAIDTGSIDTGADCGIYYQQDACENQETCNRNNEFEICETIPTDTGNIDTGNIDTGTDCGIYDKKKDCEDQEACNRDKEFKFCEDNQTIDVTENYQFIIQDPNSDIIETSPEIIVHSDKITQHINGELKIPK